MGRVLILGYYGFGNAGDEAILDVLVHTLRDRLPDARLTILSERPRETEARYGVEAVSRLDFWTGLRMLRPGALFLLGGGSLLQDTTSLRSLLFYLFWVVLARVRGATVVYYAIGIGPLSPLGRFLTAHVTRFVRYLVARDEESVRILSAMGIGARLGADPVLTWDPPRGDGADRLAEVGLTEGEGPLVVVAIRPWPGGQGWQEALARFLDRLVRERGARILFLPFQPRVDRESAQRVKGRMTSGAGVVGGDLAAPELLNLIREADLLVASRLHALVFAAVADVPMIGISYDQKVTAFLHSIGEDPVGNLEEIRPDLLMARAEAILADPGAYRRRLRQAVAVQAEMARLATEEVEAAWRNR